MGRATAPRKQRRRSHTWLHQKVGACSLLSILDGVNTADKPALTDLQAGASTRTKGRPAKVTRAGTKLTIA